jgi:hypothetical protein
MVSPLTIALENDRDNGNRENDHCAGSRNLSPQYADRCRVLSKMLTGILTLRIIPPIVSILPMYLVFV